jgi:hypothetical protein
MVVPILVALLGGYVIAAQQLTRLQDVEAGFVCFLAILACFWGIVRRKKESGKTLEVPSDLDAISSIHSRQTDAQPIWVPKGIKPKHLRKIYLRYSKEESDNIFETEFKGKWIALTATVRAVQPESRRMFLTEADNYHRSAEVYLSSDSQERLTALYKDKKITVHGKLDRASDCHIALEDARIVKSPNIYALPAREVWSDMIAYLRRQIVE